MRIRTRFCLAVVLVTLIGCGSRESRTAKADEGPAIGVRTTTVQKVDLPTMYEATGTIRARTTAQITSRLMAYVREVRVHVGDHVRPGQVLVTLDARDLDSRRRQAEAGRTESHSAAAEAENSIASARANLELAEATFNRMKNLYDKKSLSDQEFDEAGTRLKLARANLDMVNSRRQQVTAKIAQADEEVKSAEIMNGYAVLAAPFAGVVTEKTVEPGNLAMPGAALMLIERGGGYRLEVSVEESNLAQVKLAQPVSIQLDSGPGEIQGHVGEIVPAVDPAARSFTVKIDLPTSPRLRSGQFGRARFVTGRRPAVMIPAGAIQEQGQIQWVFAVEGGRARTRMVSLGDRGPERAEVLSGLSDGDRIVFPVPGALRDGARVEVRP